ncbi:MAG: hypothetical protein A2076_00315 [Geobacteraceae bacterium GWC2_53_11]|nr:MAG: hypothetical protein A2076_00315 [Geobacteraceae bacterium GWC2_53_11]
MNSLSKMPISALFAVIFSSVVTAHGGGSELMGGATNSAYLKECGACHLAYQPQFLPKRSWEKVMNTLDSHFGDSAALDDALKSEILGYLVKNSADASSSKISRKMLASLGTAETPLKISDTPYFKRKHREVRADVFKRKSIGSPANCTACHLSADKGDYDEHKVKIPRK